MGLKMVNLFRLLLCCIVLLQPIFAAEFVDCSQLPKPIRPHECCRFPQLFKQNSLVEHCKQSQSTSEQCFFECIFEATEIFRNSKFSWRKAEDYVDWVLKTTDPFLPIYKASYRKCIDKVNSIKLNWKHLNNKNGCNPLPEMLFLCVQNEMFASCPSDQWNYDVGDCGSKRNFMNNCIRDE